LTFCFKTQCFEAVILGDSSGGPNGIYKSINDCPLSHLPPALKIAHEQILAHPRLSQSVPSIPGRFALRAYKERDADVEVNRTPSPTLPTLLGRPALQQSPPLLSALALPQSSSLVPAPSSIRISPANSPHLRSISSAMSQVIITHTCFYSSRFAQIHKLAPNHNPTTYIFFYAFQQQAKLTSMCQDLSVAIEELQGLRTSTTEIIQKLQQQVYISTICLHVPERESV